MNFLTSEPHSYETAGQVVWGLSEPTPIEKKPHTIYMLFDLISLHNFSSGPVAYSPYSAYTESPLKLAAAQQQDMDQLALRFWL